MTKYRVEIEFMVRGYCDIEADSEDEAIELAENRSQEETIIIDEYVHEVDCMGTLDEVLRLDRQKKILKEIRRG